MHCGGDDNALFLVKLILCNMFSRFIFIVRFSILFFFCVSAYSVDAATLRLAPDTGVYTVGTVFTVSVLLNTQNQPINAADGQLSFNPKELQVVGVSRAASIFNLWTEEPTFSNATGVISFGGGSPSGYRGVAGSIITITFRPVSAGTPKVTFTRGSTLAADGLGTNVLTSMNGGTYTIAAQADSPAPEYIPPVNTPQAPQVTSTTHPDETRWYPEKTVRLSWVVPPGTTGVRTLLDKNPGSVPTIVYDAVISERVIDDLPEGISYFHIQLRNENGWGRITHYKIAVDTEAPTGFTITEEETDTSSPHRTLVFTVSDTSPIKEYKIQIDGKDPFVYRDEDGTKKYRIEGIAPGYHTVVVEAFDSAGNTTIANYSFTVESFEKPRFTEYPTRINTEVIPAIKGISRPDAFISVTITRASDGMIIKRSNTDSDTDLYTLKTNETGEFIYIPDGTFERGVYIITATARDTFGRISEKSDEIRIIVEPPGYVLIGSTVVNILSVMIPLLALVLLLVFGTWYLWHHLMRWKKRVRKETLEAEEELAIVFTTMIKNLNANIIALKESRKGRLTKAESDLITQIETDLKNARARISKEIEDIEDIV